MWKFSLGVRAGEERVVIIVAVLRLNSFQVRPKWEMSAKIACPKGWRCSSLKSDAPGRIQGMQRTKPIWFSAIEPFNEWHDFSYLEPAKCDRAKWLVSLLVLWIALLDLCLRSNFSILYVAPVILLARTGGLSPLWRAWAYWWCSLTAFSF